MSVTNETSIIRYSGNGVITAFDFAFPIISTSDLKVYWLVETTGVQSTKTEGAGAHYTVATTNVDFSSGGTVTTTSGNTVPTGTTIVIARDMPMTQATDFIAGGTLTAKTIEDAFDKITMMIIDKATDIKRSFKAPISDDLTLDHVVDDSAIRASKSFKFDAEGDVDTST